MGLPPAYEHQTRAREQVVRAYKQGAKRILLVLPTGAGKTYVATLIVMGALAKGRRALVLVHTEELLDQMVASLRRLGHRVGAIKAGRPSDPTAPVQVASVQTLVSRPDAIPPFDILLLDETHHYVAATYLAIVALAADCELILGLSATPKRGDGKALGVNAGGIFQAMVVPTSVAELQRTLRPDGHPILVPVRVVGPAQTQDELWKAPMQALKDHARRADGSWRPTVYFAPSINDARTIAREASAMGMRAACVDGKTDADERRENIARYSRGELDMLTNMMVLTEGFDAVHTEVVALMRGCSNDATMIQIVGRGARSSPATGKRDALLIDGKGLTHTHGCFEDERSYSLDGKAITLGKELDPITQCPSCGGVFRRPEMMNGCPRCGAPLPVRMRKPTRIHQSETVEITSEMVRANMKEKRKFFDDLCGRARALGWKPGAVGMRFKARFGHWPVWPIAVSKGAAA